MQTKDNITLTRLLTAVARQHASDLHLTIGSPPVIRKEGELFQLDNEESVTSAFLERVIESLVPPEERKHLEEKGELTFTHTFSKVLRFRTHIYKQKGTYSLAFRYIAFENLKIADRNLPPYLEKATRFNTGLTIIGGSFDSGKTTTLAAIINSINELGPPRYITTLQRPIEHVFSSNKCIIEQREVGKDVASYTQGLKLALESDVDMVVLDHVSDKAVVKKMFEVLEAGRSVLVTMEGSTSVNVLRKLFSLVDEGDTTWGLNVLSNRLQCILMQKLVHKIGGGRSLAYEFLVNVDAVPGIIAGGNFDRIDQVLRTATEYDITSFEASIAALVRKGEVKLEDALLEVRDKNYLKNLVT